ncbi:hypothetical protein ACLOJK_039856 [Asimina triloba]
MATISNFYLAVAVIVLLLLSLSAELLRRRRWLWKKSYGPPTYPIVGCLIAFYTNRQRLLDWYTQMLAESPTQTIVVERVGARRTIITANPDNVEYMLKTKFHNFPKGQPFTAILGDLLGRGIFNVDGELWHTQRKLASHEFTTKSLRELVLSAIDAEVKGRLLPVLASAAAEARPVDLQDLLRRFAFDTICNVSLGTDPGCLGPSLPVSELAQAFDTASEISARRAASPVFAVWKMKRALSMGSERRLKEAIKLVHGEVMEMIRCKKQGNGNGNDLLSRLISGGHDEEVIRDMVISFIMAGRDTTSAALTWLFWLLTQHPQIEKDVIHEISSTLAKSNPHHSLLFKYESLKEMKVVKACLSECMRLYPPVAWDSKHAKEEDTLPDGTRVNKGDRVTYFPYGMGRMEAVWGENPLEFNPARWLHLQLQQSKDQGAMMSPYKFPVFQGGPRICLGKEMAFIQMEYVVAAVLERFQLQPVTTEMPLYVPLLTAHMAGGFHVLVNERKRRGQII